jgi:transposase
MSCRTLNDAQWAQIADLVAGKVGDSVASGKDSRLFVDAMLWIARTSAPWRDLPPALGNWNSRWRRFDRWSARGVRERLLAVLAADPAVE